MSPSRFIPAVTVLFIICESEAIARTWVVSPGETTIQDAIHEAVAGDSLVLLPGTYPLQGGIVMKGGITVTSLDGPLTTILKMNRTSDIGVFFFLNVPVPSTVEGVTVAHGMLHNGLPGGGFTIRNSSPTIQNNLIVGCVNGDIEGRFGVGCGIGVEGGAPTLRNNTIVGNVCEFGAVDLYRTAAMVEHNIVAFTSLPKAGGEGISCTESGASIVRENLFWGNSNANIGPSCVAQTLDLGNVVLDPKFCRPVLEPMDPLDGDWRVALDSAIAPGNAYSGWGAQLGICAGTTPAARQSWGSVKALYR